MLRASRGDVAAAHRSSAGNAPENGVIAPRQGDHPPLHISRFAMRSLPMRSDHAASTARLASRPSALQAPNALGSDNGIPKRPRAERPANAHRSGGSKSGWRQTWRWRRQ
jgi:hypothetical protein